MHWLKWKWRFEEFMITCSFVAWDVTVFSDDCYEKSACFLRKMNLLILTLCVMFVNFRLALFCSCQLLWNNPVWLVSSNFLPTLQLTKLHQLAMQHIPLPSLGQSNPTFPGTYPRLPREVHLSLSHHSSSTHTIKTLLSLQWGSRISLRVDGGFAMMCMHLHFIDFHMKIRWKTKQEQSTQL